MVHNPFKSLLQIYQHCFSFYSTFHLYVWLDKRHKQATKCFCCWSYILKISEKKIRCKYLKVPVIATSCYKSVCNEYEVHFFWAGLWIQPWRASQQIISMYQKIISKQGPFAFHVRQKHISKNMQSTNFVFVAKAKTSSWNVNPGFTKTSEKSWLKGKLSLRL